MTERQAGNVTERARVAVGYWSLQLLGAATPRVLVLGRCQSWLHPWPCAQRLGHPAQGSPRPAGSPGSTGLLVLVLQWGHQPVWAGETPAPQAALAPWQPFAPHSRSSITAAPCRGVPGVQSCQSLLCSQNHPSLPTLPNAKGCSFPQWLLAAAARPGGLWPMGGPCSHSPPLPGAAAAGSAPPPPDWELWVAGVTAARPNSPCPALPDRPVLILVVLGAAVAQLAPL